MEAVRIGPAGGEGDLDLVSFYLPTIRRSQLLQDPFFDAFRGDGHKFRAENNDVCCDFVLAEVRRDSELVQPSNEDLAGSALDRFESLCDGAPGEVGKNETGY